MIKLPYFNPLNQSVSPKYKTHTQHLYIYRRRNKLQCIHVENQLQEASKIPLHMASCDWLSKWIHCYWSNWDINTENTLIFVNLFRLLWLWNWWFRSQVSDVKSMDRNPFLILFWLLVFFLGLTLVKFQGHGLGIDWG